VFRHLLGDFRPDRPNEAGARWNPPGVAALYTSIEEATARAEGDHLIAVQGIRPSVQRSIYEVEVALGRVLDLTDRATLEAVGISTTQLQTDDWQPSQRIGGAVAWLQHDGLLVPSVRDSDGANLVVLTANMAAEAEIQIRSRRII
jgi:RES domain-containing protein